ncbi:MAG: hypothetical protein IJT12_00010 [Paludibacteraceae bacterium]|nr:hypothetical protein [Paludibacteraceae bacterium]
MKRIFLIAATVVLSVAANAKVWRVNYDQPETADFQTLKDATGSAKFNAGDTIYVEPGIHRGSAEQNTANKNCTIIGPGWGFQSSTNTLLDVESAIFLNDIRLSADSISIQGIVCNEYLRIWSSATHAYIERCKAYLECTKVSDLVIRNNYLSTLWLSSGPVSGAIEGNIIIGTFNIAYPDVRLVIDHNTICVSNYGVDYLTSLKTIVTNNILINTNNSSFFRDEAFTSQYPIMNNVVSMTAATVADDEARYANFVSQNTIGATIENTFTRHIETGITDDAMYYQVKAGAAAKTADANGGECGAFGGEHPYQLHGRPAGVPYLYDINVPKHTTNNSLSISFKVAGSNE